MDVTGDQYVARFMAGHAKQAWHPFREIYCRDRFVAAQESGVDVKTQHAKAGGHTLENDFLPSALGNTGPWPDAKR